MPTPSCPLSDSSKKHKEIHPHFCLSYNLASRHRKHSYTAFNPNKPAFPLTGTMLVWEPANTWSQTYWPTGQNKQVPRKSLQGGKWLTWVPRPQDEMLFLEVGQVIRRSSSSKAFHCNSLALKYPPLWLNTWSQRCCLRLRCGTSYWGGVWELESACGSLSSLSLLPSWESCEDGHTHTHTSEDGDTHVWTGTHTQSHELYPASLSWWPITPQTMSPPSLGCFHKLLKEPEDSFSLCGPSFLCPSLALPSE